MKKQFIFGSLMALTGIVNAQWSGTGTNPLWSSGQLIGIGTSAPTFALDLRTSTALDGIRINQNGTSAGVLRFTASSMSSSGAHDYGIYSSGPADPNPGSLEFYDHTMAATRLFIKSDGNIGIGTRNLSYERLYSDNAITPLGIAITYKGVIGDAHSIAAIPSAGAYHTMIGVEGRAAAYVSGEGNATGVYGLATNGGGNIGGDFLATGTSAGCGWNQYGVRAEANTSLGSTNYGIYASASGGCNANYAGWFNGNIYCTGSYLGSDQKLKKEIKPLENSMEKIKKLNPSSYVFKIKEFEALNLPNGKQLGLIAQELEKVFPELIQEVPETERRSSEGKEIKVPGFKSVNYIGLIPVLISGIQEQQKQIEDQAKQNNDLKSQVTELQKQVNELVNRKTGNATGINQPNTSVDGFSLNQNIPNPFSQETVIKYMLPDQINNAYLAVYDLSGKQITSFPLTEKGAGSITISSERLAAGMYIYSVIADNKVLDSKRMVVTQKQ